MSVRVTCRIESHSSKVTVLQYLIQICSIAIRDMFCAGRVPDEDLKRTMKACGGSIQTTASQLTDDVLGQCDAFEEIQIGGER